MKSNGNDSWKMIVESVAMEIKAIKINLTYKWNKKKLYDADFLKSEEENSN